MICCTYIVPLKYSKKDGMSTIKIVLRKKANKQGLFPIAIRITKNRKASFVYTGQYIDIKYWDSSQCKVRKSHPNSVRLNHMISKKLSEVNDSLLEVEVENQSMSAMGIKSKLLKKQVQKNFFHVAELHLNHLADRGKVHQVNTERGRLNIFKTFLKSDQVLLEDITPSLLQRFQKYLVKTRKISGRTVMNYMILIRTVYNLAIREEFVKRKYYPFGKGRISITIPETSKIGLNQEEVIILENLSSKLTPAQNHALNIWLFSFYFAGMRIADVLKLRWSFFIDGRLHYKMGKNEKILTLKVPEKVKDILKEYETKDSKKSDLIFHELRTANFEDPKSVQTRVNTSTRKFNRHLKNIAEIAGIEKNLSCHIARHTFGNISGNKIPVQILQKLYRHSDIRTTINYQSNFIHKDEDDALDSVINF